MSKNPSNITNKYIKKLRRRNIFSSVFKGMFTGLVFFVLLWFCYFMYNIPAKGMIPVEPVLRAAGYIKKEEPEYLLSYIKKDTDISVQIPADGNAIIKSGYTFPADGSVCIFFQRVYINKAFMEQALNLNITKESLFSDWNVQPVFPDVYQLIQTESPLIAHAGGGVTGKDAQGAWKSYTYTNSLEAIIQNYEKGLRMFEIDFSVSKDKILCALHDWSMLGEKKTAEEFLSGTTEGGFTRLSIDDVLTQMEINTDMILVLDFKSHKWKKKALTKYYNQLYQEAMKHGGEDTLKRIIPQIYSFDEYDMVKEVYDWTSIILTLYAMDDFEYDEVLSFVKDKDDIQIISSPQSRITSEFASQLESAGKKYYTHTINQLDDMISYKNIGVDGFYTDFITPESYYDLFNEEASD